VSVFSTGAAEVSAISSLLTYDLYRAYFNYNADAKKLKQFSQWNIIGIGTNEN
jgi:Na+/proline symporter